ncbi:MAG: YbaN family protein [Bacteroidales bacterium]|nr:YbaN family protein [Bacteroidales bacterium]
MKLLFIILGTLSLCIGIIGIVVPGLPTTPFLLITAGLYIKSSDTLYQKLITNRFVGSYILEFQANKGMTIKTKLYAIGAMWVIITVSCIFFITPFSIKLIVLIVGLIGTIVMGFLVPTVYNSNRSNL